MEAPIAGTFVPLREEEPTPVFFRWTGLVLGIFLLSDGMRRFIAPHAERDLYAFLGYIAVGLASLIMAGYKRAFVLGEEGLTREISLWGKRVRRPLLGWEAVTRVTLDRQGDHCLIFLEDGKVQWRIRVPQEVLRVFSEWLGQSYPKLTVPDLREQAGEKENERQSG